MFSRKLVALEYHNSKDFDVDNIDNFKTLVVWLEDQKIRFYKVGDRSRLRDDDSANWNAAFNQYLTDLGMPYANTNDKCQTLDWLLGYAIRVEYGDNVEKYSLCTTKAVDESTENIKFKSENPLDNLDFDSPDFKAGVASLAGILRIQCHPNHLVTLEAICKLVKEKLAIKVDKNGSLESTEGKSYPLKDTYLGFDTGDYVLNEAAKILRLLYIRDLRELQTRINEIIVAVQKITANPKTDSRLGKVGR